MSGALAEFADRQTLLAWLEQHPQERGRLVRTRDGVRIPEENGRALLSDLVAHLDSGGTVEVDGASLAEAHEPERRGFRRERWGPAALKRARRLIEQLALGSLTAPEIADGFLYQAAWIFELAGGGVLELGEAERSLREAYAKVLPEQLNGELDCRMSWLHEHGKANPRTLADRHREFARPPASLSAPASESETGHSEASENGHDDPAGDAETRARRAAKNREARKANEAAGLSKKKEAPPLGAIVVADGQRPRIVADVERVLGRSGAVYSKGPVLVSPTRLERAQTGQLARPAGALLTPETSPLRLVELAMQRSEFVRHDLRTETGWRKTDLPTVYAAHVIERRGNWPTIPPIRGVSEHPILRDDGSVAQVEGYDEQSRFLLDFGGASFPAIPDQPSKQDALDALAIFKELLSEFKYADPASRGVHVAGFLTLLARPACPTVPLFGYSAPAQGAGKTYAANLPQTMATGRSAHVTPGPDSPEEFGKLLLSILIEGDPYVLLDNIERPLRSAKLAGAITSGCYRDRVLGASKTAFLPVSCTFAATGVNLAFAGDLARRALECRINADEERPEERRFKSKPHDVLRARRGEFVAAGLTILRWWATQRSELNLVSYGSFDEWTLRVREAIVGLTDPEVGDPCDSRVRVRESDPEAEGRATLLGMLATLPQPFTANEAARALSPKEGPAIEPVAMSGRLRAIRDTWTGERRLVKDAVDTNTNAGKWRVEFRSSGVPGVVSNPPGTNCREKA